jgi:phosphoglycolate phosphatase
LITDVDNTLFDWVALWHATFTAMLEPLIELSGVEREQLLDEIRLVHQRHRTSEYAFLVEEVPCLRERAGTTAPAQFYDEAIHAFRRARKAKLELYPGVLEYLTKLRADGILLVAYTESLAYYTEDRFRKLGLDRVFDYLYSPADHDFPAGMTPDQVRQYPPQYYKMAVTEHRHTPPNEYKPNPQVLRDILRDVGALPDETVYVGDSLLKDVSMAQDASVLDVHAAYGVAQNTDAYALLRRVTHWRDEDVARERAAMKQGTIVPTIELTEGLPELSGYVDFVAHQKRAA